MNIFEQVNDVKGRKNIYTDKNIITENNILDIVASAFPTHLENVERMKFLLKYEKGNQPLQRTKKVRKDINVECVDNLAHLIANFKTSYEFGNTITLIQRGERDNGTSDESLGISMLNECFASESVTKVQQEIARYVEICGLGYSYIDFKKDREDGDSYFTYCSLNPLTTFIIKSSYHIDRRPMIAVTYRTDEQGNTFFTCFTKDKRFEIKNLSQVVNGKQVTPAKDRKYEFNESINNGQPIKNLLGIIPITEWELTPDRMGCFERQIQQMDSLNIMESDFINGLDQNVQSIWQANDVEFPTDENGEEVKPKSNDWVMTYTTENGRTPFIKPMTIPYDFKGILDNIVQSRNAVLQNACVPQRNDNNGGSTGVAMSDATGWSSAEMSASQVQAMQEASKMNEVKIALRVIKNTPKSEENNGIFNKIFKRDDKNIKPLLDLNYSDVAISVKRQKTYEMTVKTNAFATLISHGVNGLHAIKEINFFSDPSQVWEDSKDGIEKYQKSIYDKTNTTEKNLDNTGVQFKGEGGLNENKANRGDRLAGDESDQTQNSNNIDGIK